MILGINSICILESYLNISDTFDTNDIILYGKETNHMPHTLFNLLIMNNLR